MSLGSDIDYVIARRSGLHGRFARAARRQPLAFVIARVATPLDRLVLTVTRGRTTATALLTGLPVLWVETIGARSGNMHVVPLLGIPTNSGGLALIGSAFGTLRTPAWVYNLREHDHVDVLWDGNRHPVRAVELVDTDAVWERAIHLYPGYADYRRWASQRSIAVFELLAR